MKKKKKTMIKFSEVYAKNKDRRFNEIIGVKNENASIMANPKKVLKENKYKIIIISIIIIALLLSTMYKDLGTFFITLAFLLGICIMVGIFNTFKMQCSNNGINISFGFQKAFFPCDKIKSIYLEKHRLSYLIPTKLDDWLSLQFSYDIVVKYMDANGYIKELSFSTLFVTPEEINKFLDNFIIEEKQSENIVKFEKVKLLKQIGKILLYVFLVLAIVISYIL